MNQTTSIMNQNTIVSQIDESESIKDMFANIDTAIAIVLDNTARMEKLLGRLAMVNEIISGCNMFEKQSAE